ncbi:hypothetical protein AAFC00_002557 [Neodothiora populina]|uniref:Large ribosomal subunit protein bL32m n=1 Tax=Neodothiora populina TaxID=2781224 RepID=A0ABR3P879_9PEZI
MVLRVAPSPGFLQSFLAVADARLAPSAIPSRSIFQSPVLQRWPAALLPAVVIPIPSLVTDIWESILRAVPKKKTSHMKKRHRQMAGKALKDVTSLNKCSACGRTKRAHVLCPYCVASIKRWFGNDFKPREKEVESKGTKDAAGKAEGGAQ